MGDETRQSEFPSRRRSTRIVLRVPLVINSTDSTADTAWEQVQTLVVSKHGGMVRTRQNFPVGSVLEIRMRDKDRTAQARVVWTSSQLTPHGLELGFEFVEESGFWDVSFPPDRRVEQTESPTPTPESSSEPESRE